MLSFLTVIDITFQLIIKISFSEAIPNALQIYLGKNPLNWGKNYNLALGMGPYSGPVRGIEKGLNAMHNAIPNAW